MICLRKGEVPAPPDDVTQSPSDAASSVGPSVTAGLWSRRKILMGVPAALAVVAGGALLARRASQRGKPAPPLTDDSPHPEPLRVGDPPQEQPRSANRVAEPAPEARERAERSSQSAASAPPSEPGRPLTRQATGRPMARLALAIAPWGEVYVDGRKRGMSPPLTEIRLVPGKHHIEIRNTAFQPYVQTVSLDAEAHLKIKHKFQ